MKRDLPSVFIGSSSEGLDVARAVEVRLSKKTYTHVWEDGIFQPGFAALESLTAALEGFDFAVMIVRPDDLVESREQTYSSPRDNVLFELGLFMGRLGRERTFILHEDAPNLKMPSDLAGIARVTYKIRRGQPDVSVACTHIERAIARLGFLEREAVRGPAGVVSFDEVNSAFISLKNDILRGGLKVARAELIQHSSERAFTLVSALADARADVTLYLQHPDTLDILCSDLKQRVTTRLDLYRRELQRQKYGGKFRIFLYKTPASLNGLRLWLDDGGVLLALSWYTYVDDEPPDDLRRSKFRGSANPCLLMDSSHPNFSYFDHFFTDLVRSCEAQAPAPYLHTEGGA